MIIVIVINEQIQKRHEQTWEMFIINNKSRENILKTTISKGVYDSFSQALENSYNHRAL